MFLFMGFHGGSVVKNPSAIVGDMGSIPGSGKSPGEGNGKLLQYSCLENSMDRGVWWATVHGITKESDMTEHTYTLFIKVIYTQLIRNSIISSNSVYLVKNMQR